MAGHETDVAATFATARQRATERQYEVIFCDIGLPDGDGTDLPAIVLALYPATRMVAITGHGTEPEEVKIRAAGFDDFVLKPALDRVLTILE